jgi:hypothetical protein
MRKSKIIEECWNKGSETNKNRLNRFRLIVETYAYNCMEMLEKIKKIEFELRNEKGLHCRFCGNVYEDDNRLPRKINLYETSPQKGIVCSHCRIHLEDYGVDKIE